MPSSNLGSEQARVSHSNLLTDDNAMEEQKWHSKILR